MNCQNWETGKIGFPEGCSELNPQFLSGRSGLCLFILVWILRDAWKLVSWWRLGTGCNRSLCSKHPQCCFCPTVTRLCGDSQWKNQWMQKLLHRLVWSQPRGWGSCHPDHLSPCHPAVRAWTWDSPWGACWGFYIILGISDPCWAEQWKAEVCNRGKPPNCTITITS